MKDVMVIRQTDEKLDVLSNGVHFETAIEMLSDVLEMLCVSQGRYETEAKAHALKAVYGKLSK